jgi:hypothetical protein
MLPLAILLSLPSLFCLGSLVLAALRMHTLSPILGTLMLEYALAPAYLIWLSIHLPRTRVNRRPIKSGDANAYLFYALVLLVAGSTLGYMMVEPPYDPYGLVPVVALVLPSTVALALAVRLKAYQVRRGADEGR